VSFADAKAWRKAWMNGLFIDLRKIEGFLWIGIPAFFRAALISL
jgi:hypothetical protein